MLWFISLDSFATLLHVAWWSELNMVQKYAHKPIDSSLEHPSRKEHSCSSFYLWIRGRGRRDWFDTLRKGFSLRTQTQRNRLFFQNTLLQTLTSDANANINLKANAKSSICEINYHLLYIKRVKFSVKLPDWLFW